MPLNISHLWQVNAFILYTSSHMDLVNVLCVTIEYFQSFGERTTPPPLPPVEPVYNFNEPPLLGVLYDQQEFEASLLLNFQVFVLGTVFWLAFEEFGLRCLPFWVRMIIDVPGDLLGVIIRIAWYFIRPFYEFTSNILCRIWRVTHGPLLRIRYILCIPFSLIRSIIGGPICYGGDIIQGIARCILTIVRRIPGVARFETIIYRYVPNRQTEIDFLKGLEQLLPVSRSQYDAKEFNLQELRLKMSRRGIEDEQQENKIKEEHEYDIYFLKLEHDQTLEEQENKKTREIDGLKQEQQQWRDQQDEKKCREIEDMRKCFEQQIEESREQQDKNKTREITSLTHGHERRTEQLEKEKRRDLNRLKEEQEQKREQQREQLERSKIQEIDHLRQVHEQEVNRQRDAYEDQIRECRRSNPQLDRHQAEMEALQESHRNAFELVQQERNDLEIKYKKEKRAARDAYEEKLRIKDKAMISMTEFRDKEKKNREGAVASLTELRQSNAAMLASINSELAQRDDKIATSEKQISEMREQLKARLEQHTHNEAESRLLKEQITHLSNALSEAQQKINKTESQLEVMDQVLADRDKHIAALEEARLADVEIKTNRQGSAALESQKTNQDVGGKQEMIEVANGFQAWKDERDTLKDEHEKLQLLYEKSQKDLAELMSTRKEELAKVQSGVYASRLDVENPEGGILASPKIEGKDALNLDSKDFLDLRPCHWCNTNGRGPAAHSHSERQCRCSPFGVSFNDGSDAASSSMATAQPSKHTTKPSCQHCDTTDGEKTIRPHAEKYCLYSPNGLKQKQIQAEGFPDSIDPLDVGPCMRCESFEGRYYSTHSERNCRYSPYGARFQEIKQETQKGPSDPPHHGTPVTRTPGPGSSPAPRSSAPPQPQTPAIGADSTLDQRPCRYCDSNGHTTAARNHTERDCRFSTRGESKGRGGSGPRGSPMVGFGDKPNPGSRGGRGRGF